MCRRSRRHLPLAPFRRGVFLAWMFDAGPNSNHSQQLSPTQFAQRAKAKGYEWAALEYDDPNFSPETWYPPFRDACIAVGLLPGVWFTTGGEIYRTPADAKFAIAEVEGPGDLEGLTNVIKGVGAGPLPSCPLAIVTNFSTLTRENCKPLIDAGFSCLPEAYMNESANMTPDRVDYTARNLGWPTSQPVAGVYPVGGNPAPSYDQWADWPLADYLGEYVI